MMPRGRRIWTFFLVLLLVNILLSAVLSRPEERMNVPYTFFRSQIEQGNVKEVTSQGDDIQGEFKRETEFKPEGGDEAQKNEKFETVRPSFGDDGLLELMLREKVTVNAESIDEGTPLWQTLIFGFGPTLLLVGIFIWFFRR